MLRQILARGLDASVRVVAAFLAALMIDMQSVFILGAHGFMERTKSMAQSSAAAAVQIRFGGVPKPYPNKVPVELITTMPNPVPRIWAHSPNSRLPSVYHVASLRASWSPPSKGFFSHLKVPHARILGAGFVVTPMALCFSNSRRSFPNLVSAIFAVLGSGVLLLCGAVREHTSRCGPVPGSALQSWQLEFVTPHFATFAFRICGHWPPLIADTK